MNEYANENEQWEAIRDWWRKNGVQLVAIFAISLAIGLGWRYWQGHQLEKKQQASQLFDQLLSVQASDPNSDLIPRIATELETDYARTSYAPLAALFEAKNAVAKNDLPLAEQKLLWAVDHAKATEIREIAKIRLARVLLADKKPEQALAFLEKDNDKNFSPAIEQVKGDIYLTQGETAKARTAYQNAFNSMPSSAALKKYVEMQLNQLPAN
jgi:predicted negative regulator of RcsB-dependent stress response